MRKRLIALLFAALSVAAPAAAPKTVTLEVRNMSCGLCPVTVRKSLEKIAGVSAVKVDFDRKTATVSYDPDRVRPAALTAATAEAGYPSTLRK